MLAFVLRVGVRSHLDRLPSYASRSPSLALSSPFQTRSCASVAAETVVTPTTSATAATPATTIETAVAETPSASSMGQLVTRTTRAVSARATPQVTSALDFIPVEIHPFKQELTQLGYAVGKDILKQVDALLARKPNDVVTYEMIFRALGRVGKWEKALAIFETLHSPTVDCYRAILRVLAGDLLDVAIVPKSERSKEALRLFNQMLYTKLVPDADCATYVMTTQRKCGNLDEVERIFQLVKDREARISQGCFNALMLSCVSRPVRAQAVFSMCEKAGQMTAVPFYGLILSSLSDWKYALSTLQRLLVTPYFLTPVLSKCFDAALKACERAKQLEATSAAFAFISHWDSHPRVIPEPDPVTSTAIGYLIDMCGEGPAFVLDGMSNPQKAKYWIEEGLKRKFEPVISWYASGIKACTKGGEGEDVEEIALQFMQQATKRGLQPTLPMFEHLIAISKNWTIIGELLGEVMNSRVLQPDTQFVGNMLEKMMTANQSRKAQKFYSLCVEKNLIPVHWISYNPPVMNLHSGSFAMSVFALKAGLAELHDLYLAVQKTAKQQSARPRRLKHPLLLVCRLDNIAEMQKKLGQDMSITTTVLTQPPKDSDFILPAQCAILEVDTRELTFWHTRGALGI